ncbi:holo-ACP synthase [bacterium]|nr:holo-ACP synthase [bacterium]
MISGIGIDLIEVQRIREAIEKYGERFLKRIYTSVEIEYCSSMRNAALHYAGRFAAKEAAFKAMERGWGGDISWTEIEVHNEPSGAPRIVFYGKALALVQQKNVLRAHVTISHIEEHATAVVVLEV